MTKPNKPPLKSVISGILVTAAFLWLVFILYRNHGQLAEIFSGMDLSHFMWLTVATLLVFVALSMLVPLFHIVVHQNCRIRLPVHYLAKLFFTGQIISYLPSRFLGTAYMVNETQKLIPAVSMIRINIELVAMILVYNGFIAAAIMAYYMVSAGWALTVFALGTVFFALYLRLNLLDKFLGIAAGIAPPRIADKLNAARSKADFDYSLIGAVIALLLTYWVFYTLSWLCLKLTFPILAETNVILLSATYTLSWIVGFVTLITPGGLGIREVSFVALNAQFMSQFESSFLSIFLRIWLIVIDICLFFISRMVVQAFPVTLPEPPTEK